MGSKQGVEAVNLGVGDRDIGNLTHIPVEQLIHDAKTIPRNLRMTPLRGDSELGVRAARAVEDEVGEGWVNDLDDTSIRAWDGDDGAEHLECGF